MEQGGVLAWTSLYPTKIRQAVLEGDLVVVLDIHPAMAKSTLPPVIQPLPVQTAAAGGGKGGGEVSSVPAREGVDVSCEEVDIGIFWHIPRYYVYQLFWW